MSDRVSELGLDGCDRTVDCPSTGAHLWNCLKGRARWRRDGFTATPEAAAAHAAINQDPYLGDDDPDWDIVRW